MVSARRPPKIIALMGTPFGIVRLGSSSGIVVHGCGETVNSGWAAFSFDSGVHLLPRQSRHSFGTGPSLPSHQTSPSGVSPTLVKMVSRRDGLHGGGIGLGIRAGHDAKISGLRIDGVKPSVRAGFHPRDVVADRPDFPAFKMCRREPAWRNSSCRTRLGTPPRHKFSRRLAIRLRG